MTSYWDWLPLELKRLVISYCPHDNPFIKAYSVKPDSIRDNFIHGFIPEKASEYPDIYQLVDRWNCVIVKFPVFYENHIKSILDRINDTNTSEVYGKIWNEYRDKYNFMMKDLTFPYILLKCIDYSIEKYVKFEITICAINSSNTSKLHIKCNDITINVR